MSIANTTAQGCSCGHLKYDLLTNTPRSTKLQTRTSGSIPCSRLLCAAN